MTGLRQGLIALCFIITAGIGIGPSTAIPLTTEQQLGKDLFSDKTLSHGGNQSCSSCHDASASFTDPDKSHPTSKGDNPTLFGNRNSPTVRYSAFSPAFHYGVDEGSWVGGLFLDGRAATLDDQAKAPFLNPVEMGDASHAEVISHLKSSTFAGLFLQVYGPSAFDDTEAAYNNLAKAIATYERSKEVSPFSSKFDAYLKGQVKLDTHEQRGMELFNDPMKGNCSACHISTPNADGSPPLFTDFTYDNIGVPENFDSDFLSLPTEFNPDGINFSDVGLGHTVNDRDLDGAFKVPTLRDIALTAPYSHNGYFTSLKEIVDFYATRDVKPACPDDHITADAAELLGCWAKAEFPDTMNEEELGNLPLTDSDKDDIVAFLGTLTDGFDPTASSNVPEPSTWATMLAVLGLVGAGALWRRKRKRY